MVRARVSGSRAVLVNHGQLARVMQVEPLLGLVRGMRDSRSHGPRQVPATVMTRLNEVIEKTPDGVSAFLRSQC